MSTTGEAYPIMFHPRSMPRPKVPAGLRVSRARTLLVSVAPLLSLGVLHTTGTVAAPAPPAQHPAGAGAHASVQPRETARVSAAVVGLDGGSRKPVLYGADTRYDTASIVKVDVLAALLLRAQDAGRPLSAQERALAEPMIRKSDNAAANALWRTIGRAPGLEAANKRLGLTSTQGGEGTRWGLTRTTASDQIRLLLSVFDDTAAAKARSPLNDASRTYIRTLMSRVASDQTWGVSSASGAAYELKNGWLQRTASGLWDVNSVGRITVDGHRYLVTVLSEGSTTMSDGVSLVERTARQAVSATAHA
ncbi:serine hydrolase [Streptomyces sp. NPDC006296]|uniref:serine hydrolase n=1 Tax=Streptomyces sp. NPDC006296 TaxID=3156746 RepID=UPI0033B7A10B